MTSWLTYWLWWLQRFQLQKSTSNYYYSHKRKRQDTKPKQNLAQKTGNLTSRYLLVKVRKFGKYEKKKYSDPVAGFTGHLTSLKGSASFTGQQPGKPTIPFFCPSNIKKK